MLIDETWELNVCFLLFEWCFRGASWPLLNNWALVRQTRVKAAGHIGYDT